MPVTPQSTDETRERILAAAVEVMAELGYTRATTRIIAKVAGVNEVTLFRHFGSKRNLFSEMIHNRSALPDLTNFIESQLTGEYRKDLLHLATVFDQMIIKRKEALRLMLCEAKEFPDVREVIVQIPDGLRTVLTQYFQMGIDNGSLRNLNPELMAQGFLGMFFSFGIMREILDSSICSDIPEEQIITQFVDIFISGTQLVQEA